MSVLEQTRNDIVLYVLTNRFELEDHTAVKLDVIIKEVNEKIRFAGEYVTKDQADKLIKVVLREKFPKAVVAKYEK